MHDILEHPDAYRMPCLSPHAIHNGRPMEDSTSQRWNEFEFSYSYFPGQTLYHGGLLVKRDSGETVFFIGDSFTPTGMDDYCLLNRNFLVPEEGFSQCLRVVSRMPADQWLINQHVEPMFHYSAQQIDFMTEIFEKRRVLMAALFPWDDPNFGLDEQWARFYPYETEVAARAPLELKIILRNHSPSPQQFRVTPHVPDDWPVPRGPFGITVRPRQEGSVEIPVKTGKPGLQVITADVAFGSWDLREWIEALVTVK